MACNVAKKTSLVARLRECFFGFADSAKEEHFIKLSIQERMTVLCVFSVMVCASSIKRVMSSEDWSQNPFGCILLEPNVPVPVAFLVWTLRTARWRWVDPAVFVCHAWRFAIILLWLVCDAASVPAVVQWWSSPTASVASFMCYSTLVAVVNYLVNVRFIGGLMMALVWVALAPCMAHRSLADIKSWPLVLAMVVVVLIRMFSELSTRSKYLELYYSNSEVLDYSNSTTQVKQAGCPTIKNGEAGNSTAEVKVYSISTTEVKEAVNSTTRVKDSGNSTAVVKETGTAAHVDEPTDELSDQEFEDLVKKVKRSLKEALTLPTYHTVYLRVPDADPDDLAPDAKLKLGQQFEAAYPDYIVHNINFLRGSLLVDMLVTSRSDTGAHDTTTVQMLKDVERSSWLSWLGLPADMHLSVKIDISSERRSSLLDGLPLAVTVPKSEEHVHIVPIPLRCTELPEGVAIKACLGNHILECSVVQARLGDVPSENPSNDLGCTTLQVKLPIEAMCESSCWLLTVKVQDLSDHVMVADKTVVLLGQALAVMVPELCSLRLLRPQDMPTSLKTPAVEQPFGAELVLALGWWLQFLYAILQQQHEDSQTAGHKSSQQLSDMWSSGNHLLLLLVGNGCKDSAKHVIERLLNFPALRPFVHKGALSEGLGDTPSFHDFISGAENSVGSSIMHLAVRTGSYAMVDEVMRWSDVYSFPCQWDAKDKHDMTPLHLASLVNDGKMAAFLMRKGDSALAHAWQFGGGSSRSPQAFSQRMSKMESSARSRTNHPGRYSSSLRSLPRQKQPRMTGPTASEPVSALPPAIMPNPAATGPSSRPASQARPLGGRPSPPPPSESTSPVVLASPRVAGGPRPDSNSSPSPMPNPSPSPSPMPNPLMIVMNYLWVVFMYLPNAHQVKRFTDHIIELNLKVIRFGQVLLMAALVRMPFKYPAGRISSLGVSTSHQRHGVRAH